jgi:hypothetical protein
MSTLNGSAFPCTHSPKLSSVALAGKIKPQVLTIPTCSAATFSLTCLFLSTQALGLIKVSLRLASRQVPKTESTLLFRFDEHPEMRGHDKANQVHRLLHLSLLLSIQA